MSRLESALVGIRPEAWRAWLTLGDSLRLMEEQGRQPVCAARPDDWHDARPNVRAEAAEACTWCPALDACRAFATANGERHGVYGGHDFTRPTRKGRAA